MADVRDDQKNPKDEVVEEVSSADEQEELSASLDEFHEELQDLKNQLDEVRLKSNEYLDGWQRSRAEFANYRKRVEREREQIYQDVAGSIMRRFLDVVDDLERALKNSPKEGEGAEWAKGIELIYRKMLVAMEAEGIKPMVTDGQVFDPNFHEAISHEDNPDHESGEIIEVVQNGYLIGDRVLRPALVRVAR
jgi:molecular chaperone GrpE